MFILQSRSHRKQYRKNRSKCYIDLLTLYIHRHMTRNLGSFKSKNFYLIALILSTAAVIIATQVTVFPVYAQSSLDKLAQMLGQDVSSSSSDSDIVLLSHRYNQGQFGDEIVGEILNNGSRSLGMFDVPISASFYDPAGQLVGSENGYLENQEVNGGDRSAFTISILDETLLSNAATYDLVVDNERVVQGASLQDSGNSDNEDQGALQDSSNSDSESQEEDDNEDDNDNN
jgi:hypothetical protein